MTKSEWLRQINSIPMSAVCDRFNIARQGDMIICPAHNDRSFGSCKIFQDANFYCFACQAHGRNIDLVRYHTGGSFMEAAGRIASSFGIADFDKDEKVENCPVTAEQLCFLGLEHPVERVLTPVNAGIDKPEQNIRYIRDDDGNYVSGPTVNVSIYDLYQQDKEAFFFLICEKMQEKIPVYIQWYHERIWTIPGFEYFKRALDYILEQMRILVIRIKEEYPDTPSFDFPVKVRTQARYSLQV